jgi:hypothetical protein
MSFSSSNQQAAAAKNMGSRVLPARISKTAARIADAIVDLVDRSEGPVPLNKIDEQVPGFIASRSKAWSYFIQRTSGDAVIWNGMSKAGYEAFQHVLTSREVALQHVNVMPYFFEGVRLLDPAWQPVVLLPIRAANIDGPLWAFRVPPAMARQFMFGPGADGRYRSLIPRAGCFTADHFFGI